MTAFALGGNCGLRGLRSVGGTLSVTAAVRAGEPVNKSRASSDANAAPCTPSPKREKRPRRVRPICLLSILCRMLIHVKELRRTQQCSAQISQRPPASGVQLRSLRFLLIQVTEPLVFQLNQSVKGCF